jgi:hypothetical protein
VRTIWTPHEAYHRAAYESEADLEAAIIAVSKDLFGEARHYLDVKRKIGTKPGQRAIPDGYLIDLADPQPRLFVVENELASHDPLRHIAVQILQFSLSFKDSPRAVKRVLLDALQDNPTIHTACDEYASRRGYRNVDHLLDYLVHETPFAALVIIDDALERLQNVLSDSFSFGVEVLELKRYENSKGDRFYHFDPFLADVVEDTALRSADGPNMPPVISTAELDTVVVPARDDGFEETFLGENRWYAVRLHGTMRPQIKYIAAYRVAPISAITHVAPVKSIEPWKDTAKFVLNFAEPAREVGPINLLKGGRMKAPQNLRYTTRDRLLAAKTLDDLW